MFFLEPFGITDAGRVRQNNEDALLVGEGKDETLFAVADGIGGFEAGEVASSIAIEVLRRMEPGDSFEEALEEANRRIRAAARGDERFAGMGTTVVAVRFGQRDGRPVAEVAHVGDSRAYLMRGSSLRPVTEDHSLVAELVRSGDLSRAEAAEHPQRNLITRALGAEETVNVDTAVLPVEAGDRVVLCSDGLSDMVPEKRISEILDRHREDPETPARRLLQAALEAGGTDNVTVVVVDVRERREEERERGGTREMPPVAPPPAGRRRSPRPSARDKRRSSLSSRLLGRLLRGVIGLVAVAVLLTPAYLWGSSRYFLDVEGGEVVVHRGLPYEVGGVQLNEEWRRTGLRLSEVRRPYREPITERRLYTRDEVERVLRDLER
ncbi:Stp1/IreP family PP2C-type Ser/Thr phosphatase [Rubrobacter xylanophilus]|nr:Stp1/IreP family PP2C-type Ser/Thr phosphatase [Rubrobacter xylanophilus]